MPVVSTLMAGHVKEYQTWFSDVKEYPTCSGGGISVNL